jgi:hypothetical protein
MTDTMRDASSGAADTARAVGTTAKERGSDVATTTSQEAKAVAEDAREQARRLVDQSRDQLRAQASDQTTRLAGSLRDIGDQLHDMARGEAAPEGFVSDLTNQLAATAHRTSARLEVGGFDGAISDVKRFARNRPGVFLLGALGAGFAIGRLAKAVDTRAIVDAAKGEDERSPSVSSMAYRTEPGELISDVPAQPLSSTTPPPSPYSTADVDLTEEVP